MKNFNGKVLFLDRANINTDEIIPARYLTENSKEALRPYLLEDLDMVGFDRNRDLKGKAAIVTRDNFGCGSSREHAPWALEVNHINIVVGGGFARIFRQNMFNCGMMAIQIPPPEVDKLFARFAHRPTELETDVTAGVLQFSSEGEIYTIGFELSGFDQALVQAGGWLDFAEVRY